MEGIQTLFQLASKSEPVKINEGELYIVVHIWCNMVTSLAKASLAISIISCTQPVIQDIWICMHANYLIILLADFC